MFAPRSIGLRTSTIWLGGVRNTELGVEIHVEGTIEDLTYFQQSLRTTLPEAAVVERLSARSAVPTGETTFSISSEEVSDAVAAPIPVDRAVCSDCLREVFDPENRRYRYPFTSCTNCGPRYTIIQSMPYERSNTTMSRFKMCDGCRAEYENPDNRRFHAQTIACPDCGPQIWTVDSAGNETGRCEKAIQEVSNKLLAGKIVALRGVGGYQLLVDATNETAVARLRERKRRKAKPFAVLVESLEAAERIAELDELSHEALSSPSNPIVLLPEKQGTPLASSVYPRLKTVGLMLPTTPLHALLLTAVGRPLVCTSGNIEGGPLESEVDAAEARLSEVCDCWLHHDLSIEYSIDDSVVRSIGGRCVSIRLARGLAPLTLDIPEHSPAIAVGGYLKSAIAWSNGRQAVLSPHLGDQQTLAARQRFVSAIEQTYRFYGYQSEIIVHDLHPEYYSTDYARGSGLPTVAVQHHHAHVVAGMLEHGWLDQEVLGVAWDGTGFGTDRTICGGEFLLCRAESFERMGSLRPFRLPGGESAIHEPWRVAVALTNDLTEFADRIDAEQWLDELISDPSIGSKQLTMIQKLVNSENLSPPTTSAGRLFDAAASIILGHHFSEYDGQPAMLLEDAATNFTELESVFEATDVDVWKDSETQLDWRPLIAELLRDRIAGVSSELTAFKFHSVLASGIVRFCERFPEKKVVLGGGVFQNRLLTEMIARMIPKDRLGLPGSIPPNDGGLAAGQLVIGLRQHRSSSKLEPDRNMVTIGE